MTDSTRLTGLVQAFLTHFDARASDQVWEKLSGEFRRFWSSRVLSPYTHQISDEDCDVIISILDRNAKGNTKENESVAVAMVPQGAWRRIINEFHSDRALGAVMNRVLTESDPTRKAACIDELYALNQGRGNNLTGPSGNTVGAFLAAYDPVANLSVISLKDRRSLLEHFSIPCDVDWVSSTIGSRMVATNHAIIRAAHAAGLNASARTISRFFYSDSVKPLWKGEHTVKREDKPVAVVVPTESDEQEQPGLSDPEAVRESMQVQGLIAKIGAAMGFRIWLPKGDRSRVLKVWKAGEGELLDELPLGYDPTTTKTIEQIDVLWLRRRSIVRAFEVEHTTSVYSGLLRMADLVALQPNIKVKLHIVAPSEKREKVLQEILRPVFSLLEGQALSEMCSYLSYESVREIGHLRHLEYLSDRVLADYEEHAEPGGLPD